MIHCLGSCLIIILNTIDNDMRFAEQLLILHSTELCLLLKVLPVPSAPRAQGHCKADCALCKIQFLSPCSQIVSLSFLFVSTLPISLWVSGENQAVSSGPFFFPLSVCLQLFGQNLAVELPSRALIYFDNVGSEICASPLLALAGERGGTQPSRPLVLKSCMCLSQTLPRGPRCICYRCNHLYRCDVRYKILT